MSETKEKRVPQKPNEKITPAAEEMPHLARAEVDKRIAAALVDGIPAYVICFIPYLGGLISALYLAIRDGLSLSDGRGQSFGKSVFHLRVIRLPDESPCDYATSVLRNLPFVLPALIMMRPGMGWILGSLIWVAVFSVETLLVIADERGERLGDRLAKTAVVEE